jgi:hypothetical protein
MILFACFGAVLLYHSVLKIPVANVEPCSLLWSLSVVHSNARALASNLCMFSIVKGCHPKLLQVSGMPLLKRCQKVGHYVDGKGKKRYVTVGKKLLETILPLPRKTYRILECVGS